MKAWNIKQLNEAMNKSLAQCNTQLEMDCCKAICGIEIREAAKEFSKTRKLTPGELAIAQEFGYRG